MRNANSVILNSSLGGVLTTARILARGEGASNCMVLPYGRNSMGLWCKHNSHCILRPLDARKKFFISDHPERRVTPVSITTDDLADLQSGAGRLNFGTC